MAVRAMLSFVNCALFLRNFILVCAISILFISSSPALAASILYADDLAVRNERRLDALQIPVLSNTSAKFDLISDIYKIVVKVDIPPNALNSTHVSLIRLALADEIGVSKENVQLSHISDNELEIYVDYSISYDGGRQINFLVPANQVLGRLSLPTLNRVLQPISIIYIRQKTEVKDVTMRSAVSETRIWDMFEKEIWKSWQLPFLIVSCLLLLFLLTVVMIFFCLRQQIRKKTLEHETKHVCLFPVVKPDLVKHSDAVQSEPSAVYLTQETLDLYKRQPIRIKAKGLLERRGSNASLTIDLNPSPEHVSSNSFSRDNSNEEYLLSAGNRMNRKELKNCLKDPKALHNEFWEIPMNHPEKVEIAGSGTKNRYRTILPNEHSRVKLAELNDDVLTTYINANYIRGYDGEERAYIATQGPMPHTVVDFWRMVWSEQVCIVVMITKLREKNKIKCEPYIPDRVSRYDDIEVTVVNVISRDGYVVRELYVRKGNECMKVLHFWYTTWPDHKTPASPKQLVAMAVEVESHRCDKNGRPKGPVLVHCSAGIGRTGCFIASSIGMQQLLEEHMVDVLSIVCVMRQGRGGMVQTAEQYEFVHRSLCLFEESLPEVPGGD